MLLDDQVFLPINNKDGYKLTLIFLFYHPEKLYFKENALYFDPQDILS